MLYRHEKLRRVYRYLHPNTDSLIRVANKILHYVTVFHFGKDRGHVSRNNVTVVEHEGEAQP